MSVHLSHFARYLTQIAPHFTLDSLRRLETALDRGEVIQRQYRRPIGETGQVIGCLLWTLDPAIDSRHARHDYFSGDHEALAASERMVFYWDSDTVTSQQLLPLVQQLIRQREKRSDRADAAIELVHHGHPTCTIRSHEQIHRRIPKADSVVSVAN